jgi:hypothetical protein
MSGTAAMALALIVVALGAGALWVDGHRGHDGYVSLGPQQLKTAGRVVSTPSLVAGNYIPHWLVSSERVTVSTIDSARPVFVGIVHSGHTENGPLAEARGRGPVALSWKPGPGQWNVNVTNADGSRGVHAQVTLAAKVPSLLAPGLILVAVGLAVGLGGFAVVRPALS